ncbi:MAG TPA: FMN-binding glutamate synthase family protein [Candidatus Macondimonas sp.]|nr:FMN-binding glutamate synthase family protein [Candidatus Macondimonas sp.]
MTLVLWFIVGSGAALGALAVHDLLQRHHAILRIYPVIGHFRYLLEGFGPELRQYIVTGNEEERPFSRNQRRWVYATAKRENNQFAFGTDQDLEHSEGTLIIRHHAFPLAQFHPGDAVDQAGYPLPAGKILGAARGRRQAFRPASIVNISGMSFGALSGVAVEALNRGAHLAGCWHNTGEGGLSDHHRKGGDVVFQIGTGYFGCRDAEGGFSLAALDRTLDSGAPVRALEIKLSQGAKPGLGGLLPGVKVTPEIAAARGVLPGRDCKSPARHAAFGNVDALLDFVESLAHHTGLPVGIKSAVGDAGFWEELAMRMASGERGVDFISIDGGEGGTGAAPLVFADRVALPFKAAFPLVYKIFHRHGLTDRVVFIGSARLGLPDAALWGFGMGCDLINVGREALLAIGCIQSQKCHTGRCPTGVTTHTPWRTRGLDPALKSVRLANYVIGLRRELTALARACGEVHPALIPLQRLALVENGYRIRDLQEILDYPAGMGQIGADLRTALIDQMAPLFDDRLRQPTTRVS